MFILLTQLHFSERIGVYHVIHTFSYVFFRATLNQFILKKEIYFDLASPSSTLKLKWN